MLAHNNHSQLPSIKSAVTEEELLWRQFARLQKWFCRSFFFFFLDWLPSQKHTVWFQGVSENLGVDNTDRMEVLLNLHTMTEQPPKVMTFHIVILRNSGKSIRSGGTEATKIHKGVFVLRLNISKLLLQLELNSKYPSQMYSFSVLKITAETIKTLNVNWKPPCGM